MAPEIPTSCDASRAISGLARDERAFSTLEIAVQLPLAAYAANAARDDVFHARDRSAGRLKEPHVAVQSRIHNDQ